MPEGYILNVELIFTMLKLGVTFYTLNLFATKIHIFISKKTICNITLRLFITGKKLHVSRLSNKITVNI